MENDNGCTEACVLFELTDNFVIPPTETEIAEREMEKELEGTRNATFDIIFAHVDHRQYEDSIRDFCRAHRHPSAMVFLHLPVADELTLDCAWDEDRDLMIVTEAEPDELINIETPRQWLH